MFTKRNTIICDECGLFCNPIDEYIPFGCADPEAPEPLDPSHTCKKCYRKVKEEWISKFRKGDRDGNWQKSNAEMEAAKECGLIWIGSNGIGVYGTKSHKMFCYITKREYENYRTDKN